MAAFLEHMTLVYITSFALIIGYATSTINYSAQINSTFTIPVSDYELQSSIIDILFSPNGTFQLKFGNLPSSSVLVWYTYRDNNPSLYDNLGGTSTSLHLQLDGDLVVSVDVHGVDVLVWYTSTSQTNVVFMNLTDDGNLILLNSSECIVWQSFDHPTNTLLSAEKLPMGKSLIGAVRNAYPFVGRNVLTMEAERLVSYVIYEGSEPYWQLSPTSNSADLAYVAIAKASLPLFDKDGKILASRGNSSSDVRNSPLQRFILDVDGNMRLYEYDNSSSQRVTQMQVILEACDLPGKYPQTASLESFLIMPIIRIPCKSMHST